MFVEASAFGPRFCLGWTQPIAELVHGQKSGTLSGLRQAMKASFAGFC
jgi:hypothetical protein